MTWLVLYLLIALGISFLCSVLESVMLSVPRTHVGVMAKDGTRAGRVLAQLTSNIDRPLAAILALNTIAHTIGAAGVGAQSQAVFGEEWLTVTSVVLTLLILLLSEIIPKTLGAVHAKRLAGPAALVTERLVWLCYPLVVASEAIATRIAPGGRKPRMSRAEMVIMAELGEHDGAIDREESRVIRNLLRLKSVLVRDVMTPRSVVSMIQQDTRVGQLVESAHPLAFARTPVYGSDEDEVVGAVHRYALLQAMRNGEHDQSVGALATPLSMVAEDVSVDVCFDRFIAEQQHLFLVVDERGQTAGVVSLEDAVETLLGVEIVDETDTVEDMRELAKSHAGERRTERSEAERELRKIIEPRT